MLGFQEEASRRVSTRAFWPGPRRASGEDWAMGVSPCMRARRLILMEEVPAVWVRVSL